jgi:adenylylsulfate kinase
METRRRSMIKALSWRVLAAIITTIVVLAMTGKMEFAAKVGALDTTIKLLIYFLHERAWNKISYGRLETPDYEV